MNPVKDVYDFQTSVLKNYFPPNPIKAEGGLMLITLMCISEELEEFENADTISDQADALIDLIYFAFGALHQMGINAERVWNEVHRANMTKKRGSTKRGHENDATKPDGWKAPDHSWLDEDKNNEVT